MSKKELNEVKSHLAHGIIPTIIMDGNSIFSDSKLKDGAIFFLCTSCKKWGVWLNADELTDAMVEIVMANPPLARCVNKDNTVHVEPNE